LRSEIVQIFQRTNLDLRRVAYLCGGYVTSCDDHQRNQVERRWRNEVDPWERDFSPLFLFVRRPKVAAIRQSLTSLASPFANCATVCDFHTVKLATPPSAATKLRANRESFSIRELLQYEHVTHVKRGLAARWQSVCGRGKYFSFKRFDDVWYISIIIKKCSIYMTYFFTSNFLAN